jgi:hypothetical protein
MFQNGHQIPCSQNGGVLWLAVHLHIESGVLCNWDWPHVWNLVLGDTIKMHLRGSYGGGSLWCGTQPYRLPSAYICGMVYCCSILDPVFAYSNVRPSILLEEKGLSVRKLDILSGEQLKYPNLS